MLRSTFMKLLFRALLLLGAACAASAWAQGYPAKTVRIIVNFPPGGVNDVTARIVAPHLSRVLGQPVIIENKPGAGTTIGTDFVAKSAPDGHVLMVAASSTAISPSLYRSLPFDPRKDLAPVALIGSTTNYLVVGPKTAATTVGELAEYARRNPGRLNFASSGNGTSTHLTAELMKIQGNFTAQHIPYRGVGPAMAALLSGEVDFLFDAGPASIPSIQAGRARLLAVTTRTRSPLFPDVPTMIEAGFPEFDVDSWTGIMTTGGTPQPVIDRLEAELRGIVALPEVIAAFEKLGMAVHFSGARDFADYFEREIKRWAVAVKYSGAQAD
jgi:tripartite-type tricarboxylate transporter receptor subunit TctC